MQTAKRLVAMFLVGALGAWFALGVWRLYTDYMDFLAIRAWVAQVQQAQREMQAKQQQAPAPTPQQTAK